VQYPNDLGVSAEPVLQSTFSFFNRSDDFNAFVEGRVIRNLLFVNANGDVTHFDNQTVQVLPSVGFNTNTHQLFGQELYGNLSLEAANFWRPGGAAKSTDILDPTLPNAAQAPNNTIEVIREAKRISVAPTVYTTVRPFDTIAVVPSATYQSYFYNFGQEVNDLYRSYLLLQADISTQLEKIYDTDDPDNPRIKHLIRPQVTLSWIPQQTVRGDPTTDPTHPFNKQIAKIEKGRSGYMFDDYDIFPLDTSPSDINYFVPEGKSISYGFTTQLIERKGAIENPDASYLTLLEWSAGSAYNFYTFQTRPTDPEPLTRVYSTVHLNWNNKLLSDTTYYYYPYDHFYQDNTVKERNTISTSLTYVLERASHQRVLLFDRSINLSYSYDKFACNTEDSCTDALSAGLNYSINDYILPSFSTSYTWIGVPRFLGATANVKFQSPSQCWALGVGGTYTFPNDGFAVAFDFSLNLTGTGFGGISEVASQAMTH
jgi:hypothetical protein